VVDAAAEREDHVLLPPHDPLRHAGGTAGVEEVVVVGRARAEVARVAGSGERLLVRNGAERRDVLSAAVLDDHEVPELREPTPDRRDPRRELPLVDQRHQVRVVEEVGELRLDVAIVDVDGDGAQLVAGEHPLDELRRVEGVDADVLAGRHALRRQVVRQSVRAPLELRIGAPGRIRDEHLALGHGVDGRLEEIGDVPFHPGAPRRCGAEGSGTRKRVAGREGLQA
jgi:hypothetical protein